MNLAKTEERPGPKQKHQNSRSGLKCEEINHSSREMIRFVIDDYRAGILKLDGDEELRRKVESLKEGDDWEALSPDVRALALVKALRHRAPDA